MGLWNSLHRITQWTIIRVHRFTLQRGYIAWTLGHIFHHRFIVLLITYTECDEYHAEATRCSQKLGFSRREMHHKNTSQGRTYDVTERLRPDTFLLVPNESTREGWFCFITSQFFKRFSKPHQVPGTKPLASSVTCTQQRNCVHIIFSETNVRIYIQET